MEACGHSIGYCLWKHGNHKCLLLPVVTYFFQLRLHPSSGPMDTMEGIPGSRGVVGSDNLGSRSTSATSDPRNLSSPTCGTSDGSGRAIIASEPMQQPSDELRLKNTLEPVQQLTNSTKAACSLGQGLRLTAQGYNHNILQEAQQSSPAGASTMAPLQPTSIVDTVALPSIASFINNLTKQHPDLFDINAYTSRSKVSVKPPISQITNHSGTTPGKRNTLHLKPSYTWAITSASC